MRIWRNIAVLLTALLSFSCAQKPQAQVSPIVSAVPSDALAAAVDDRLEDLFLNYLDSTDIFRSLPYGSLLQCKAAISWCFTSALSPVLAIHCESEQNITDASIVLTHLSSYGLFGKYVESSGNMPDTGFFVLSTSETLVASLERHLKGGASIQDAQSFSIVTSSIPQISKALILKGTGAQRWLRTEHLGNSFTKKEFAQFLKSLCEWTVLIPETDGSYRIELCASDSPLWFSKVLQSEEKSQIQVCGIAPDDAELVLSVNAGSAEFRKRYEDFLDASVRLDRYSRKLDILKKEYGKKPGDIEEELGIQEVALIRWEGRQVSLLRCGKSVRDTLINENPYRGLVSTLYGSAFSGDDGWMCSRGRWRAFGSREDVEAFSLLESRDKAEKSNAFYFRNNSFEISSNNNKGIRLWKSNR